MPDEIITALIGLTGALIGAGAASITTIIINRNERHKFARERIWDLRREAYSKIISALGPAQQIGEHVARNYNDDPEGYDAGKPVREAMAEFTQHYRAARDFYHGYRLVLSDQFAAAYEGLLRALSEQMHRSLGVPRVAGGDASYSQSQPISLLQFVTRGDPLGGDDVRPLPAQFTER
jgi:hypothetical protein